MVSEGSTTLGGRLSFGHLARALVGAGVLGCLMPACSLLLDTQAKQCEKDEDCWSRGLSRAVCVQELCELPAAASSSGAQMGSDLQADSAGKPGTAGDGPMPASPGASDGSGMAARAADPTAAVQPDAGTAGSRARAVGVGAPSGTSAADPAAQAPQAAANEAAACTGDACPECTTDADCVPTGGQDGHCVDGVCWRAQPQCSADADCFGLGPEFDGGRCIAAECRPNPRWRCEAPSASTSTEPRTLSLLVRDSLSLNPVPMVHIVACQKLDLTCANPTSEGTTDRDGMLSITVPAAFAGYLQQTERRDYAPAMYFLPSVLPEDGMLHPFPLLSSGAIIDALAASLGAGIDPERGHMMLIAEDCFGMALPGVTFMSPQRDDDTVQFYVRDVLPSTSATETAEIGNGGYLNFPAGTAVLQVDRVEDDLHLATVTVVVRAGFISVAYIRPQQR